MIKEKKSYSAPRMEMQVFVPDAYARMCNTTYSFKVKCDVNGSDESPTYDTSYDDWGNEVKNENNTHSSDGCGNADNQALTFDNNTKTWTFQEINSDQGSDLKTIFSGLSYTDIYNYTTARSLAWQTQNTKDNRVWHHHGHITNITEYTKQLS